MRLKILSLLSALLLIGACSTDPEETADTGSAGATRSVAAAPGVTPGSTQDFIVNVGDRVFFEFNKANLTDKSQDVLDKQADWLQKWSEAQITVAGHCDERGTREYNLALGERRANSVKDYLVSKGIAASRIKTISYGKERPAVLGSNEWAWSQNRRSVSSITAGAQS
jgi:peptidoglycan-associated lipoprotein